MKKIFRTRFLKIVKKKKCSNISKYLDKPIDEFIKWIEFQFDNNMSWENHGTYWEIDHVIPCNSFDLTNEDDIKKCFIWSNLRPLEKKLNSEKRDKICVEIIKNHNKIINKYINSLK
jgi:hypothetical protein